MGRLSNLCMYLFGALLIYVLFVGGETRYIIESGLTALGNAVQNFISMSTWADAERSSSFPQNWTIFYWAYWLVWCVAAPFFMGGVSRGRTVRHRDGSSSCFNSFAVPFVASGYA